MIEHKKRKSEAKDFVTEAELDAALEHILAAPTEAAPISWICYRPDFGTRVFPDKLHLCPTEGVQGDRWAEHAWMRLPDGRPDPRIQVCIMGERVMDLVWKDRENTAYPGDTIIADMNFAEADLPAGSLLKIGTCVVEVSDVFNDACTKWKARYGAPSRSWLKRDEYVKLRLRGVFCRIVQAGTITKQDIIEKL